MCIMRVHLSLFRSHVCSSVPLSLLPPFPKHAGHSYYGTTAAAHDCMYTSTQVHKANLLSHLPLLFFPYFRPTGAPFTKNVIRFTAKASCLFLHVSAGLAWVKRPVSRTRVLLASGTHKERKRGAKAIDKSSDLTAMRAWLREQRELCI